MKIYSLQQMRDLEAAADKAGHSYSAMMDAAGTRVAQVAEQWIRKQRPEAKRVVVLVGPGNNGGDGLVAARELSKLGYSTVAYLWKRDEQDALVADARQYNISLVRAENDNGDLLARALDRADVILDALFGTGLSRPIEGKAATILKALKNRRTGLAEQAGVQWMATMQQSPVSPVPALLAVDVPSGLRGDTGEVDDATVAADVTITFAAPKLGMLTPDGADVLGDLVVADIGVPQAVLAEAASTADLLTPQRAADLLPPRPRSGHKGTFGAVMVVGGSLNYLGAPALAAIAAGRTGAGLVTLGVASVLQPMLAARPDLTTATWLLLPHDMGALRPDGVKVLAKGIEKAKSLVLGPGMGTEDVTRHFIWNLLGLEAPDEPRATMGFAAHIRDADIEAKGAMSLPPTVIDADGLNNLAAWEGDWWEKIKSPLVLTPHPAEMGRLLKLETKDVQKNRLQVAQEAAERWQQVVVLKGAYTVVAAPNGRLSVAPFANDALGKAGAGDVLSGITGALLAQGLEPYDAACLAVTVHGLAGERLRRTGGGRGTLASNLLDMLPMIWQSLEKLKP